MKKIMLRIAAALFAFALIGFILTFANAFMGNPISSAIATSKIKTYVKDTYPQMDLTISKASYNFKISGYGCRIASKTSMDTNFYVSYSGGRINDDYEYEVANCFTTYRRLQSEFEEVVEAILAKEFPYETSMVLADYTKEAEFTNLTLDMKLDVTNPPLTTQLSVYTSATQLTYEEMAKRLLELDKIMKNHSIPINLYSLVLEKYDNADEKPSQRLHLYEFPESKLASDDLIAAMKGYITDWESPSKEK